MARPRKSTQPSAGSALRDAMARNNAAAEAQEKNERDAAQRKAGKSLSDWFNDTAQNVRDEVTQLQGLAQHGGRIDPQISFSAPAELLRDRGGVSLESLPGFKELDKVSKELDVETTVCEGRHGYGRKINAGKPYLHVTVDVSKPYAPLTTEKPEPEHRHQRPHRHNGYKHGRR